MLCVHSKRTTMKHYNYYTILKQQHIKRVILILIAFAVCVVLISVISIHFSKSKQERRLSVICEQYAHEKINWNYFYAYENSRNSKGLVWCKIPKVASTTMTKLFLRLAGTKRDIENSTRIHKLLRQYYPRINPNIMNQIMMTSSTIMIVRDPFERILSAYRDKLENYERDLFYRDGYYYKKYGRFMIQGNASTALESNGTRKEPTWVEFVQYLTRTSVARYDEHWMPMSRLCSPCNIQFDAVIKLDRFHREIQKYLKQAGISPKNSVGWSHKTGSDNKQTIREYFKNLTSIDVKRLYIKYKRDFEIFGYTPFKYFKMVKNKV